MGERRVLMARRRWLAGAAAALSLLAFAAERPGRALADDAPGFRLVVHPQRAGTELDRDFLADAFLKKVTRWPDGEPIRAVDLRFDAPARRSFCEQVLRRSLAAVRNYWQ